jgi:hypothetical protein
MQHRTFLAAMAMAVAAMLSYAPGVQAGGTLGFADTGTPTVNTGNINTATTYNIGDLVTTSSSTGFFAGLPTQTFGPVSFTTTSPTSLSFSDTAFGSFTSTSITLLSSAPGAVAYYILGNYTAGTYDTEVSGMGSFTISFTQTPANTGAISDSASLAAPPAAIVPEPASLLLGLTGMGALGMVVCLRRRFR